MADDAVTQVSLTDDGQRPEGLPENFATVVELVNSYKELQAKSTQKAQQAAAAAEVTPADDKTTAKPKKAVSVEQAKLDSALEEIHEFNLNRRADRFVGQVGSEGLAALQTYLDGPNIAPNVKAAYEAALESGNEALIDANFTMLKAAYEAGNGTLVAPTNVVAGIDSGIYVPEGTEGFASLAEQLAAQNTKEYYTDPAHRAKIEQRIAVSGPYPRV